MELCEFARHFPSAAIGFSGGVDSAYLLYIGLREGADWKPVYICSVFQPAFELEDAKRICVMLGAELTILEVDVLSYKTVQANPSDRCYHCKHILFSHITEWAKEQGIPLVLDGSNASDAPEDRPGMRAVKELGIRSPLREAGLTKAMIRKLSREAGLFTWNKPAYACLATRVPSGTPIDKDILKKVDLSEAALREMGFSDFRVRLMQNAAKLQLTRDQLGTAIQKREQIINTLKPYFSEVLLDLKERPGIEFPIPAEKEAD